MENNLYEKTERLIRHWWLSLVVGLVAVAVGFIVLVHPAASYYTFATWLGIVVFISGIAGLMQSFSTKNYFVRRGWLILASVVDLIIGLMLMFNTLFSAVVMPILLGAWLLPVGATIGRPSPVRSAA